MVSKDKASISNAPSAAANGGRVTAEVWHGSTSSQTLAMRPLTLTFRVPAVEGEYLMEVAKSRWPVLVFIFCFDIACYTLRFMARCLSVYMAQGPSTLGQKASDIIKDMGPQLANMAFLYLFIGLLNRRSRKHGDTAARQEEMLLSACMAIAICNLLASLTLDNAQDYVYVSYFLICTSTFLKIRWWVGTLILATPTVLANFWHNGRHLSILPQDAVVHILVAWAVGGLMGYLVEWYRRQMFASQKMAALAHQKELLEAQARIKAQRQLAAAQAQAAQRALSVAREKAANEAKSEFMSLMCHEVRTPLNGCLASAEMLLETELQEEQRELAKTIRVSGSILLSTVSNFLDFFKMEAGKALDIVRTEVDLVELVSDVHCIIEAMIGRSGEVCLLNPEMQCVPQHIVCDPDRVRGILLNLYTNAAKFTKSGHIGLKVHVVAGDYQPTPEDGYSLVTVTPAYMPHAEQQRASLEQLHPSSITALLAGDQSIDDEQLLQQLIKSGAMGRQSVDHRSASAPAGPSGQDGDGKVVDGSRSVSSSGADTNGSGKPSISGSETTRWLLFEVMDTGIGIAEEGLKSLFKEYVQGTEDEMKKPRSKGGTGLGLSICSKQVGVLGGRIGAYSAPCKGSVFWFTIPLICPEYTTLPPHYMAALQSFRTSTHPEFEADTAYSSAPASPSKAVEFDLGSLCASPAAEAAEESGEWAYHNSRSDVEVAAMCVAPLADVCGSKESEQLGVEVDAAKAETDQVLAQVCAACASIDSRYEPAAVLWDASVGTAPASPLGSSPSPIFASSAGVRSGHSSPSIIPRLASNTSLSSMPEASSSRPAGQLEGQGSLNGSVRARHSLGAYPGSCSHRASIDAASFLQRMPHRLGTADAPVDLPPHFTMSVSQPALPKDTMSDISGSDIDDPSVSGLNTRTSCGNMVLANSAADRAQQHLAALKGRKVLLVEDNLINQTVARKMLNSLGLTCEVACNGLEAVRAVEARMAAAAQQGSGEASSSQGPAAGFDVVLMDMAMPVMGGVDATRALRQLGATVPILAMTANASDKDRDECRAAGMDGFLSKPVLKDRLAEAITQVLSGNSWSRTCSSAATNLPMSTS